MADTNLARQSPPICFQPKPLPLKRHRATFLGNPEVFAQVKSSALHKYRRRSANGVITRWLESVSRSKSHQGRHRRRSDSFLNYSALIHSDNIAIPPRLTKSAPIMKSKKECEGFTRATTPSSMLSESSGDYADNDQYSCSRSVTPEYVTLASSNYTRSGVLVSNPLYREVNLDQNHIFLLSSPDSIPEHISNLVGRLQRYHVSSGPSLNEVRMDTELAALGMGASEANVASYFQSRIFLCPGQTDVLKRSDKLPMARHAVPNVILDAKISNPVPDLLYGYNRTRAFTDGERTQITSMGDLIVANSDGSILPFLAIEQKGDGPASRGSLWVATNQCLGASASCVNIAERFNQHLRNHDDGDVKLIDTATFSIAMNGTVARLYVSWKHDELRYHTAQVGNFLLQMPGHYIYFRRHVLGIIAWGAGERLNAIRSALDGLLEARRKAASRQAKARPSPSLEESNGGQNRKRPPRGNGIFDEHSTIL